MANPMTAAAEEIAPSRASTNFFDPAAGASVLARYAGAAEESKGADALAQAQTGLARNRMDISTYQRRLKSWDREDQDYEAKQDYKRNRGEFLRSLSNLDPADPDYLDKRAKVYSSLPMEAQQDDAAAAIISAADYQFKSMQAEKERDINYKQSQADMDARWTKQEQARQDAEARRRSWYVMKQGMPPELVADITDPTTGDIIPGREAEAAARTTRWKREAKQEDDRLKAEAKDTVKSLGSNVKAWMKLPDVFPSKVAQLIRDTGKSEPYLKMSPEYAEQYKQATDEDASKEASVARDAYTQSKEEFVRPAKNARERQIRSEVWDGVQGAWAKKAPAPSAPTAPAAAAPAAEPAAAPAAAVEPAAKAAKPDFSSFIKKAKEMAAPAK